jgi:transcriptional regulator with GAF, ATPase, and Fis domain
VLQEGELERVGEERTRRVDVRLIAATNRDLRAEAEAGRFRQDLYYRLSVFPIELPPLRRRVEDIPPLAEHFLALAARKLGRPKPRLTLADAQRLQRYRWPGNVRELQHVIERAVIIADGARLVIELPADPAAALPESRPSPLRDHDDRVLTDAEVRRLEADNIRAALRRTAGKVSGPGGAAELLGIKPTTLGSRIKALGLLPRSQG